MESNFEFWIVIHRRERGDRRDLMFKLLKIDIAAKRHPSTIFRSYGACKIHKNNNLHIGISNSYGR